MQNPFKVRSTQPDTTWYQFFAHFTLKNDVWQNLRKLLMRTSIFQSTLHAKPYTLKEPCTFKEKCAVNAENFMCDLLSGPLRNIIFKEQRTIFKERAFEQCIAT